jgi:hypothetical protein
MKFLVTWKVVETLTQEQASKLRPGFGQGLQQMLSSPKVKDAGIFGDVRGGYFIFEVDEPHELTEIMGPEVLDNTHVEAHPVASLEEIGRLFGQWAEQGR